MALLETLWEHACFSVCGNPLVASLFREVATPGVWVSGDPPCLWLPEVPLKTRFGASPWDGRRVPGIPLGPQGLGGWEGYNLVWGCEPPCSQPAPSSCSSLVKDVVCPLVVMCRGGVKPPEPPNPIYQLDLKSSRITR